MKKFFVGLSVAGLIATLLTGCAPAGSVVPGTVITVGQDALASNLNSAVLADEESSESNGYIHELTQASFYRAAGDGSLVANTAFGEAKVLTSEPDNFVVSYQIKRKVTWSDGTPINAVDLLVSWAAATNAAGAGFASNLTGTGLAAATETPQLAVNGRRLVVKFSHPVADWQTAMQLSVPAHVLGKLAFGASDAQAAKDQVQQAITSLDAEKLKTLATKFNDGFALTDAAAPEELLVTSGSYAITSASNSALVLQAKTDCAWCIPAKVETVNLKLYGSASDLLTAIKASEVDLAEAMDSSSLPLATLVSEVSALDANGYKYSTLQSGKIQAMIVNYGANSLFGEQKFFKNKGAIEAGRQGLLLNVPRQRIVDSLGIPIKLTRSDSFAFLSTEQPYQAAIQSNGSSNYRIQDVEQAKELLRKYKLDRNFKIRVLFDVKDLNSQIAFNLMNQYSGDARLNLANGSTDDVAGVLQSGKYEAYLTQLKVLDLAPSTLGLIQNAPSSKPSDKLNELIAKLAADPGSADRSQILADIDTELFASGYGLPLYELPKVVIFSSKFKNYASPAGANSAVSNFDLWNVAPEKTK